MIFLLLFSFQAEAQLTCPAVLGIVGFGTSPVFVTPIDRSIKELGDMNRMYRGKFTDASGADVDFLAVVKSRSEDPSTNASFELSGKALPPLEHMGLSLGLVDGVETKSDAYQLSLWNKSDRRYMVTASVRYVKNSVGEWVVTTGKFTLVRTHSDPKQKEVVLELAGLGIAESILKHPIIEK